MFKEHDVISSWAVLGLVDIKMKFQAASTFWLQLVQGLYVLVVRSFHLRRGSAVKNKIGMCIKPLSVFFQETGNLVILLYGRIIV